MVLPHSSEKHLQSSLASGEDWNCQCARKHLHCPEGLPAIPHSKIIFIVHLAVIHIGRKFWVSVESRVWDYCYWLNPCMTLLHLFSHSLQKLFILIAKRHLFCLNQIVLRSCLSTQLTCQSSKALNQLTYRSIAYQAQLT